LDESIVIKITWLENISIEITRCGKYVCAHYNNNKNSNMIYNNNKTLLKMFNFFFKQEKYYPILEDPMTVFNYVTEYVTQ